MNLSILTAIPFALWVVLFADLQSNPSSEKPPLNPYEGLVLCSGGPADFQLVAFEDPAGPLAPRLDGLGDWNFTVTTDSEDAQYFFNQGLRLVYAFNHAEAHRAFREAARLDPDLAMAYWGQAYSLGPNINDPFPDDNRQKEAQRASEIALQLAVNASDKEKALIAALQQRCTDQAGAEQQPLNLVYHAAMQDVFEQFGDDPDVATLFAAAIMNTMPWNYYDEQWEPRPNTEACVAALKGVIEKAPGHAGAHHYFIHIIEARAPRDAIPSADALDELMPAAGHIVHMPSHIYLAVGYYDKAAEHNRRAITADQDYIAQCQAQGVYPLAYYPHNIHFLWAATAMLGASEESMEAAAKVASKVPAYLGTDIPFIQDFMAVPLQAYTRFGKWNEILTTPEPPADLLHTRLIWHYARGMAFTRKGQLERAKAELSAAAQLANMEEAETLLAAYNNPTSMVGQVATASLAGEIANAEGDLQGALEQLYAAVELEDGLVYQEPAAWHAPVRQYLGAVLLENGRAREAETVYRADLEKHPHNGWSLFGLGKALEAQGKKEEAKEVWAAYEQAWAHADVELVASRF